MAEQLTVAVNAVPGRTDTLLSLHVGPSWVLLSAAEAKPLAIQIMALVTGFDVFDIQCVLKDRIQP